MAHEIALHSLVVVRSLDIAQYRNERLADGLSPSTVTKELALLAHSFSPAIKEWGSEINNPVLKISKPELDNARERRLSPVEECHLMAALDGHGASMTTTGDDRRNGWVPSPGGSQSAPVLSPPAKLDLGQFYERSFD